MSGRDEQMVTEARLDAVLTIHRTALMELLGPRFDGLRQHVDDGFETVHRRLDDLTRQKEISNGRLSSVEQAVAGTRATVDRLQDDVVRVRATGHEHAGRLQAIMATEEMQAERVDRFEAEIREALARPQTQSSPFVQQASSTPTVDEPVTFKYVDRTWKVLGAIAIVAYGLWGLLSWISAHGGFDGKGH